MPGDFQSVEIAPCICAVMSANGDHLASAGCHFPSIHNLGYDLLLEPLLKCVILLCQLRVRFLFILHISSPLFNSAPTSAPSASPTEGENSFVCHAFISIPPPPPPPPPSPFHLSFPPYFPLSPPLSDGNSFGRTYNSSDRSTFGSPYSSSN